MMDVPAVDAFVKETLENGFALHIIADLSDKAGGHAK